MVIYIPLKIIIPISLVVVILIVVLWYLYSKNKKIYAKITLEKTRFHKYKDTIKSLKESPTNPKKDFKKLNKTARGFFKEYLNLVPSLTYLELAKTFKKQNKKDYEKFSRLMSDIHYKGQRTDKNIKQVVEIFNKIIEGYK